MGALSEGLDERDFEVGKIDDRKAGGLNSLGISLVAAA
jgi:hypothetical protein